MVPSSYLLYLFYSLYLYQSTDTDAWEHQGGAQDRGWLSYKNKKKIEVGEALCLSNLFRAIRYLLTFISH